MDDVKEIAERMMIINNGSLIFDNSLSALTKKYANHKTLKIILNKEVDRHELKRFGKNVHYSYPNLTLKVKPHLVSETAASILNNFDVDDIDISEPDLEDIVSNIFENNI
jgi:ABC-2 type transport system ATP-binding protein